MTTTLPPVMCKAGLAYQFIVLGDGTAAIRNRAGECIGYVDAHADYPKGFHGWTSVLKEDCVFPRRLGDPYPANTPPLKPWRNDEKQAEGIALADFELARKR